MKSSSQLITGPAHEPVTIPQAKLHLRVTGSAEDALISGLISAAREYVENYCQRALFTQTWQLTLDTFPYQVPAFASWFDAYAVALPRPRLQSITSITYQDTTGTVQTLSTSAYSVDPSSEPARIVPMNGMSWPYPGVLNPGTVKITYKTGTYGDGTDNTCPVSIQQAILLLIGHWYAQREAVSAGPMMQVPLAVEALLSPYRFFSLAV